MTSRVHKQFTACTDIPCEDVEGVGLRIVVNNTNQNACSPSYANTPKQVGIPPSPPRPSSSKLGGCIFNRTKNFHSTNTHTHIFEPFSILFTLTSHPSPCQTCVRPIRPWTNSCRLENCTRLCNTASQCWTTPLNGPWCFLS